MASNIELMNGLAPRYITNATFSRFLRHAEDILQFWVYRVLGMNEVTRGSSTMIVAIVLYNFKLFYLNCLISTKISMIIRSRKSR